MTSARQQARTLTFDVAIMVVAGFIPAIVMGLLGWTPYWLYATVLTPAIVLLDSAGSTVDEVAEERLGATLIGVAATVVVMLVLTALTPLATRLVERNATPDP